MMTGNICTIYISQLSKFRSNTTIIIDQLKCFKNYLKEKCRSNLLRSFTYLILDIYEDSTGKKAHVLYQIM